MSKSQTSLNQARRVYTLLFRLFSGFFLVATIGTCIAVFSVNDLLSNADHVNGTVIDVKVDSKRRRAPIVRFTTTSGKEFQLESQIYTRPWPKTGNVIKVVYRKTNPEDWQIDDRIHLYFWVIFGAIFMLVWSAVSIIIKLVGQTQVRNLERAQGISEDESTKDDQPSG